MSNYSSVPTPAVTGIKKTPDRNRRSGKGKRRKKKSGFPLTLWQLAILILLGVCILASCFSLSSAKRSMDRVLADRESRRLDYENEVRRHQVKYRDYIEYYAAVNQIDPAYVAAIIKRESDYDTHAVSKVGARGLMQLMPDSFDWIAPKCGIAKSNLNALFDPESAVKMGCYLLGYISPMFNGDPILVACAYHAGWGNVKSWIQKYSTDGVHLTLDQIPMDDTRYYAGKVLNAYAIYQQYYY